MNPIGWFEIYVDNMDRAQAFYETVLAIELTPLPVPGDDSLTMLSFPANMAQYGASGALAKFLGVNPGGSGTLVYFSCEDCAVEEARVKPGGGKVLRSKMSIGEHGFVALLTDTEGNTIGLHSSK